MPCVGSFIKISSLEISTFFKVKDVVPFSKRTIKPGKPLKPAGPKFVAISFVNQQTILDVFLFPFELVSSNIAVAL